MKKIILILISCIMLVSVFCVCASARDNTDYTYFIEFNENKNAYPIMNSKENAVGLFEYYKGNFNLNRAVDGEFGIISIMGKRNDSMVMMFNFYGSYPNIDVVVENVSTYTDFCILYLNGTFYLYGWKDGELIELKNLDEFPELDSFEYYTSTTLSDGYKIDLPDETVIPDKDDMEKGDMFDVMFVVLSSFVVGLGTTFSEAFSSMFIANGVLNSLAIFILVMAGVFLAIGIIYMIFQKFNKKGE